MISLSFRRFFARAAHFSPRDQQTHFLQACGNLSTAANQFYCRCVAQSKFLEECRVNAVRPGFTSCRSLGGAIRTQQRFEIGENSRGRFAIAMHGPVEEGASDDGLHGVGEARGGERPQLARANRFIE